MVVRELPKVGYKGKSYFYDMNLNQLRNVDDPHDFIDDPPVSMEYHAEELQGCRRVSFAPIIDEDKVSLKDLIQRQKVKSFLPEYREKATDAEALGIVIANYFKWTGKPIIEAFLSALEDANFHTLRGQIEELIGKK